eukprot:TRINITY_DN22020_c0_g1_i1.p1 TRINITY_DN22020_c0_g1~~TRINITY_DN22020_c0_g1_i1.p1  ORF type:complete len:234 (+),score=71.03 TRINITY_DN22020_c0_g1_i1:80-781(+)
MGVLWSRVMSWFGGEECRVLILGLDYAGKTTLLYRLKLGEPVETSPTLGFNMETLRYKNVAFQVWDLGGQTTLRPLWRCYFTESDAIIWVIDAVDKQRLALSRAELFSLLDEDELRHVPLCVLANKSDLACAMPVEEIVQAWDLAGVVDRPWTVRPCSAKTGDGVWEALDWLANTLQHKQRIAEVLAPAPAATAEAAAALTAPAAAEADGPAPAPAPPPAPAAAPPEEPAEGT